MGAYLTKPITKKISSDEDGERIRYGASSMQGWRVHQEDALNCIGAYDEDTALFAVYDGHGGPEVALYSSQKLPDFIKETEAYKTGDYKNALIDAFLGFDATIATREVIAVLKDLARENVDTVPTDSNSENEENVTNVCEETSGSSEDVIEKYHMDFLNPNLKFIQDDKLSSSSFFRAKKTSEYDSESSRFHESLPKTDISDTIVISSTSSDDSDSVTFLKMETTSTDAIIDVTDDSSRDSSNVQDEAEKKIKAETEKNEVEKKMRIEMNKKITDSQNNANKAIIAEKTEGSYYSMNLEVRNTRQLCGQLWDLKKNSEPEDKNDEVSERPISNCSCDAEDAIKDSKGTEDEEENSEEEEEDIEELIDNNDDEFRGSITKEPGFDSGCAAVVALVHKNKLYVANAGHCRCIVSRNGQVVEMSFDHMPENEPEMERIVKAGGIVTHDGRVNGGLNLSRALGDHAYKQNMGLSDKEQMVTASPDVTVLTINPTKDDFMVLASDGIWNFMSSQEVVEFIKPRLQQKEKLSQICEEIFDYCLAPNTMGDGTGCDNMTAIIIQFKTPMHPKRCRTPSEEETDTNSCKRIRIES